MIVTILKIFASTICTLRQKNFVFVLQPCSQSFHSDAPKRNFRADDRPSNRADTQRAHRADRYVRLAKLITQHNVDNLASTDRRRHVAHRLSAMRCGVLLYSRTQVPGRRNRGRFSPRKSCRPMKRLAERVSITCWHERSCEHHTTPQNGPAKSCNSGRRYAPKRKIFALKNPSVAPVFIDANATFRLDSRRLIDA